MYNQNTRTVRLIQSALFAALCYIGFQFFRFDFAVGTEKTAIHFGNTFCVLAALLLGGGYGGLAGAVGMTIADLTSDYITYAPKTFLLKLCIGLIVGLIAHRVAKLSQEHDKSYQFKWSLIASISGMAFNIVADPIIGYFYKRYLLGLEANLAESLALVGAVTTVINAITSVIIATILYNALRPVLKKSNLFIKI